MAGNPTRAWKQVAWNGIRFEAPTAWEPGVIGPRYLLLKDSEGPVFEVKWQRIRGRFSHRRQLQRLARSHRRRLAASLAPGPVPSAWQKALENFDASAFRWAHGPSGGHGLLLYCPTCGLATLMQFLGRGRQPSGTDCGRLLASWRDHSTDGVNHWALFDISAQIPESLQLETYRFEVGRFQLSFTGGHQRIDLYRWAPAATLLHGSDLQQLARQSTGIADAPAVTRSVRGNPAVELHTRPSTGGWNAWRQALLRRAAHRWVRLWHLEGRNRILGLAAESRRPLDRHTLDRICERYAVV